jgi:uncharacterized coiled-coil DUF342 family protein
VTCTLTDPHDCANVRAANSSLRQHLNRACDERDAALAREKTAIEEGQRLAAEVANLRDEVASWRKGVEDANRISQRERAHADAARAEADTLRHVAETVAKRSHELAELVERAATRAAKWEDEAVRFDVVARGSSIPIAREAAARLATDRRQHAAELRLALAALPQGTTP